MISKATTTTAASSAAATPALPASPASPGRDVDLDAVKGFLVVAMVVYHAMNYFGDVPAEVYGYLRFVNGAFVFLAGYAVSVFYADSARRDRRASSRRLLWRGLRLLLLFTLLNLAIGAAGLTNYRNVTFGLADFVRNAADIYGSGEASQLAFRILVPISYVLMLAPLYLGSARLRLLLLVATALAALLANVAGPARPYVFFVLTGLIGVGFGLLRTQVPTWRVSSPLAIVVGTLGLASLMNTLSANVLAYGCAVAALLQLVHDGAALLDKGSTAHRAAVLLGRYPLVCYIGQIAILHVVHGLMRDRAIDAWLALAGAIVVTSTLLLAVCRALTVWRRRSRLVDRTYQAVFA